MDTAPVPSQPRPPTTTAFAPDAATASLAELNEMASEARLEADRNKSKVASLTVAALAHVIIFAVLAWIVTSVFQEEEIDLVVAASSVSNDPNPMRDSFAKKVTNDKPAPPSRMATKAITAAKLSSPVTMPAVETISDMPAFGDSFGTGFGAGGFGSGQGANFFGTSGGGNRIILVIDTSTSMNGNCGAEGIAALRREINKTIGSLSPSTRFNIICFGHDADGFSAQPVAANPGNVARAKKWMEDYFLNVDFTRTRTSKFGNSGRDHRGVAYTPIPPSAVSSLEGTSGGSRMDLALVAAFQQKPSAVFLIADGEPGTTRNGKKMGKGEIVDLIVSEAQAIYKNRGLPTVNCISVKGIGEQILKDIAKRFKGRYKPVDPAKV